MKNRKALLIFSIAYLACFMFFMNLCTPNLADDWVYGNCEWGGIISGAYEEYFVWNSRFFSCVITRILAKLPMWITDLCGTLTFMCMLALMLAHALGKKWKTSLQDWSMPLIVWGVVVLTSPDFAQGYLWHCGQAYYLYTSVFVLAGLLPFRYALEESETNASSVESAKYGIFAAAGLCLLAPLVGCSIENTGIVAFMLAAAITCYTWRTNPNRRLFALCCAIILAFLLLMLLAPGPKIRASQITTTGTLAELFLRLMKFHAKALPLYIPTLICLYRLWKRRQFPVSEIRLAGLYICAGILSELAFCAVPSLPPGRALNITHIFIGIACLRIIWLDFSVMRHKNLVRIPVLIISLLPLLLVPRYLEIKQYMTHCYDMLEEAKGKDVDLILPAYTCNDNPYFTNNTGLVSSEDPDNWMNCALSKLYKIRSVRQSNIRCRYTFNTPGLDVSATSYDVPHLATRTEFIVKGERAGEAKWVHVACPPHWQHLRSLRGLYRYFFISDAPELGHDDLVADGYAVFSVPVKGDGVAVWLRGMKHSPLPETPVLWISVSSQEDPRMESFHRVAPTKQDWEDTPVWATIPAEP